MNMELPTRWIKIFKDIWDHKTRSLLVILSIAVGVAAVGMINNAKSMIERDLFGPYLAGNPALVQIYVSPFDKSLANAVAGHARSGNRAGAPHRRGDGLRPERRRARHHA